jgi:hypothetical protein
MVSLPLLAQWLNPLPLHGELELTFHVQVNTMLVPCRAHQGIVARSLQKAIRILIAIAKPAPLMVRIALADIRKGSSCRRVSGFGKGAVTGGTLLTKLSFVVRERKLILLPGPFFWMRLSVT